MPTFSLRDLKRPRRRRLLLTASCLALGAAVAPHAAAQDTGRDSWAADSVVVTGQRDSLTAPDAITGTRTDTPIEKIPQSIQVLTRTLIEEQDVQTISDALANVSGVTPSSTMQTVLVAPHVRGFASTYYFDGLPAYQLPAGVTDPATLINTDRVEVAKGPTATLYAGGSGAPVGGLINIVSREAEGEFGGEIAVRAGSFNTLGVEGRVTGPLGDTAAIALAGLYETADSFISAVEGKRYAYFPSLRWALSADTTLRIRGQITHLDQLEYSGLPASLIDQVDPDVFAGAEDAPHTTVDNRMATVELDHTFGDDLKGSLAIRYFDGKFREYSTYPLAQFAGTAYFFGSGQVPSDVRQTFATASLVKTFDLAGSPNTLLVGLDYDDTDYFGAMGLDFAWGVADYGNPAANAPFGATPALSDLQNDALRTVAVFAQDQITLWDRLDVTAGLRWSQLDVQSSYTSFGVPYVDTDETYSRLTPRIGATYRVADGVSVFAGYSEGFKGVVAAFGVPNPKPETSQSTEAGLKFAAPIKGLTGTVSVYNLTRQNVTTSDPSNPFQSIQTGEQRARGIEADIVYEPGPALSLLFSYGYTDAEVSEDNTLPVGDSLRSTPKHRGRLAVRYRFQDGPLKPLEIGAGVTATSERELTLPNTVAVDGLALIDAQASWDFGPAMLAVSVVNLTDEDGFEPYQYFAGPYVTPTQPRSAYITLRRQF